jgi:hypothetical protein
MEWARQVQILPGTAARPIQENRTSTPMASRDLDIIHTMLPDDAMSLGDPQCSPLGDATVQGWILIHWTRNHSREPYLPPDRVGRAPDPRNSGGCGSNAVVIRGCQTRAAWRLLEPRTE